MPRSTSGTPPRLALVTGASSGLGRAFADRLARAGSDLVLVARNASRLDAAAAQISDASGVNVYPISADLSEPNAAATVFSDMRSLGVTADMLVNNAGFNVYGRFEDSDLEKELEMIRLHTVAVTQLTKAFVQQRDRTHPNRILNVSSVAALVPGPFVSVHFATRAHLLSFSLALSEEFRGSDVSVTCLCPGPMQTEFFQRAGMTDVRLASGWPMQTMHPADVAEEGCRAMLKCRPFIVPGRRNRLFAFAAVMAPRSFRSRFTKWIMGRL